MLHIFHGKEIEAKLSLLIESINSTNELLEALRVEADGKFSEIQQFSTQKLDDLNGQVNEAITQIQRGYLDLNQQITDLKGKSQQDYREAKEDFSELRSQIQQGYPPLKEKVDDLNLNLDEAKSQIQQGYLEVKQEITETNQQYDRLSDDIKRQLKEMDSRFWGLMVAFIGLLLLEIFRIFVSLI